LDIVVLIKRVASTETRVKIAADGKSLDPSGVQYVMSPYDEIAVEQAIQLKEAGSDVTVTVVTLGPAAATKELRTALAMGADAAVHLVTGESPDAEGTAAALAEALKDRSIDLILCGRQATDVDDFAVGPMLAARLGMPCVAMISSLEVADGKATAKREMDGATEILGVDLPCLFTAEKGLAEPRYPGLKGIMAAKRKPLESVPVEGASTTTVEALELPPARGEITMIDPTPEGMNRLLEALRVERKVL
jgi:electron transfer flavoprotein beta subunit